LAFYSRENTTKILSILDEHNVQATFFLIGRNIKENVKDAENITAAGHQIDNHPYSHHRMLFKSQHFIAQEIETTNTLIKKTGDNGTIDFRPLLEKKLLSLPYYLRAKGIKSIT